MALHSDFVYTRQEWRLLHASLKQGIQHRLSSLQFILCHVIICIQKTLSRAICVLIVKSQLFAKN